MQMNTDAEVAIIGAGPIGIELAILLKKHGISFVQFDKGQIGQIIYNFPVQTRFFSSTERLAIAEIPIQTLDQQKCTREEYLAYLRCCVLEHKVPVQTFEDVVDIRKNAKTGKFEIETISSHGKQFYKAPYVVFSTGGTAKSRRLNVPGEDCVHVFTQMQDPHLYFRKKVIIIGSRNSAVEWALRCYHAGANVTLITRREIFDPDHVKYWLLPELNSLIKAGSIKAFFNSRVVEIWPGKVKLLSQEHGEVEIGADFVLKAIGFESDTTLLRKVGVEVSDNEVPVFDNATMETNVQNVFVMGTVTGGTQIKYKVFIENCHEQVHKIAHVIGGRVGIAVDEPLKIAPSITPEQ